MPAHARKLKYITLEIDGENYECQVTDWKVNPPDEVVGDLVFTACPGGSYREEVDTEANWSVDLTFLADWRDGGISRVLWANQGATVPITLVQHPDVTGEAVSFAGEVILRAPAVGGKTREYEVQEINLLGVGEVPTPTYPVVI